MNYEKIERRRKGSNIFCCDGYMYSKNNEYKNKINLPCVLYKKDCSGTAYIEFGKFFSIFKSIITQKSFAEIEKTKIEARIKSESERSTLAPRDIYNKIINPENVDSTFTKISSIMSKRRASNIPPIPRRVEEFDNLVKNPDFGTIDGNIFYRTFASTNEEFAPIFLADFDLSFLNRIHSIHVDATFKTVPVDFYQLLIIHCLVLFPHGWWDTSFIWCAHNWFFRYLPFLPESLDVFWSILAIQILFS